MNWKKITNHEQDAPRLSGDYVVIDGRDPLPEVRFLVAGEALDVNIIAIIPERIPEWEANR